MKTYMLVYNPYSLSLFPVLFDVFEFENWQILSSWGDELFQLGCSCLSCGEESKVSI